MTRMERSIPDVYNEPHLFDPPSSSFEQEHDDAETPMLPSTAASTLSNTNKNTSFIRGPNNTLKIIFLTLCLAG
jgi:hypothetical protein